MQTRHLLTVAAIGVSALLTGCSAGLTSSADSSTATPRSTPHSDTSSSSSGTPTDSSVRPGSLPSGASSTGSGQIGAGGGPVGAGGGSTGSAAQLPPAFPLPHGASISSVTRDGHEIAAHLSVTDAGAAYDFWRRSLPAAGYRVTDVDSGAGAYEIDFAGHGCGGDSQIAISSFDVAVQCDLT